MREYIFNKKSSLIILIILLFLALFYFFFFKSSEAQVCLPLTGYLVWPGTWESGWVPMASTTQYVLTRSPIYVSGSNVGIGTTIPSQKLDVYGGYIRSDTGFCIGTSCITSWSVGGITGSGSSGQVTFWTGSTSVGGDNNLFWDNTNKRLGIGTTAPQTSLHVIGNITANTFLGTINAANVSSGQFGANTGGGNYSFPGNVGIGTTTPLYKLDVVGDVRWSGTLQGGSVPWARLTSFPPSCPAGQFVTAVGSSLTCASPPSGGVSGSGTTNYLAKWTGSTTLGNSIIYDNGNVGIGTTNPLSILSIGSSGDSNVGLYVYTTRSTGLFVWGGYTGIYGYTSSAGSTAVFGYSTGDYGVRGTSNFYGVYGSGNNTGVYGTGNIYGVYGYGSGTGTTYGVYGYGTYGVYGSGSTYGVYGSSAGGYGVYGYGPYAVYGYGTTYGVYGYSSSSSGYDFYGAGPRSYFSGHVGIGMASPASGFSPFASSLDVAGFIGFNRNHSGDPDTYSRWGIFRKVRLTSSPYIELRAEDGNFYSINITLSTEKAKTNISNLGIDSNKIYKLRPVSFNWKTQPDGPKTFGLIAEETAQIIPELVSYDEKNNPHHVNYELLSVLLLDQLQKIRNEGLILKDVDGPGCHKITVNSAGTITATAVTCP